MTRKTLSKLGLAASVAAFSTGAWAADAVEVAPEAEPMDYVRICDTYGAGFYYIPGTETCLKIGGFVRYQINVGNDYTLQNVEDTPPGPAPLIAARVASDYGWSKYTLAGVAFDARSETELGTLRGFADIHAITDGTAYLDAGYIELGGLRLGKSGNPYDDGGIAGEQDMTGGWSGNRISYTFSGGNGFSASVSLDDDSDPISGAGAFTAPADFVPNVSANATYTAGPIAAGLYAAYDNNTDEAAVKGTVAYSLSDNDKLSLVAYWTSGATYVHGGQDLAPGIGLAGSDVYRSQIGVWGEWSVQGSYWHKFSDKMSASVGANYISNVQHYDTIVAGGDVNFWRVGTTIDYAVVPGFNVKTSVNYNQFTGSSVDAFDAAAGDDLGDGYVNGFVRFQRDF